MVFKWPQVQSLGTNKIKGTEQSRGSDSYIKTLINNNRKMSIDLEKE